MTKRSTSGMDNVSPNILFSAISKYSKHISLSTLILTSAFKAIILMFAVSTFIRFQIRLLGNQDGKLAVLVVVAVQTPGNNKQYFER